ncbi:MAG: hybrid sensor histidine kinase/response regulator [Sandaracinus sp.]|nr:hybrid sensor histidine kinase/response regulator [Sandaracinus sp.]
MATSKKKSTDRKSGSGASATTKSAAKKAPATKARTAAAKKAAPRKAAAKKATKKARKAAPKKAVSTKAEPRVVERGEEGLDRREILSALRALRRGEFDVRLRDDLGGLDGQIAEVLNGLAENAQVLEDDSVALKESICHEGRTQRRLKKNGSRGGWGAVSTSVNAVIDELVAHSARTSDVVQAVRRGDLEQRIDLEGEEYPLRGTFRRQSEAINQMVDQLSVFNEEVTRVAREVGTEGQLGAQAHVPKVSGAWKELTESVNSMASNLTAQVREIARVTTAVADGDLSKTIEIDVKGEILALKNTINRMVDQLGSFADEVTRVAREVGTEGRLGGQATVRGASGIWAELTSNVNSMADNLTVQVRNIAEVSSAIAKGDLSKKITVDARGEILELKSTINQMVDQLSAFAGEVTRVAREVGTEGVLGGQAEVPGVSGVWEELTDNVNGMANNLTNQVRNIAEVATAIATGDLSKKITVDARGEILTLKTTINEMVDKLNRFGAEVSRVARLVGTEGTLGVQAEVGDVSGIWRELTDNVNTMGTNLTNQVRDIAEVTTAVASGDLSKKITVEVKGELLALKNTINDMVDSLGDFADEVTRMAREVGTEGRLGGQAVVTDVSGIWRELTENVNSMASNLTNQVRNISEVAAAVAAGELSRKITVDARGEVLELKETMNAMVDQLTAFADEVTRVAREVGVQGQLGGQAEVEGVRGVWKELTENVNLLASNLTNQVRDIAQVTTAVARGDLTRKITVDARGEILELKSTINTMVDQLSSFADEVTHLAIDVGVNGKLGGQADVRGVLGTWRDLTDAVNSMAENLTDQVRGVSDVATAIAEGDLRKKITVSARGEILDLKDTINRMVDQLSSFAEEVTRVSREVGTEGKLGGQAAVEGVQGTWRELTDNVNHMANNLTAQVRDIATVAGAIAEGDLSRKVTVEVRGELLELKSTINTMVDQLSSFADEVTRVARDVGVEGKLGGQAEVRGVSGIWKELTGNVNLMASNLTDQVRDIARVTTAVASGDLSRQIQVEVKGEFLELKETVNTMVEQLRAFADQVTRVAREVGTEGILGGQAEVPGVSGTWRELTDNVNLMARNLTEQVRGIARVVTAVAVGDLEQELRLEARGEIATLVDTINEMIGTLSRFAEQVTGVAHDVGVEGKLGGQADVPGAAGVWRELTGNVNELAGNLTRQVRAIGTVATAVTRGDLSQSIDVDARGEVAELKDNLNQMIRTLAETTRINEEQDWLKTNVTRFTRMLQGQRDMLAVARGVLSELAPVVGAQHGAFYMARRKEEDLMLHLFASYAYKERKELSNEYDLGEGLVGQAALEGKRILVRDVPGDYVRIGSALGDAPPLNLVVAPVTFETEVKGVIELASFQPFTKVQLDFLDQLTESLGIVVATIEATMRTDELLRESQRMAEELQTQQEELQQTNEELEEQARQLTTQRDEVERKNKEVELARQELEEKAEQLALTSRYKSQFLANMSHELRTPLNSLLILSEQLAQNRDGNLSGRQVEYAETVHQAGADLLALINEILDLAKIESGTMAVDVGEIRLEQLADYLIRTFEHLARDKGLDFSVAFEDQLPDTMRVDEMRLKQVLRNLIANAIKFTDEGRVEVKVEPIEGGRWQSPTLNGADLVLAFSVQDSGIGIAKDKQPLVFEAFQQVEGGTSRKHGGTGLGLAISREIAGLLGGELHLESTPGEGSLFTLFLPSKPSERLAGPASRVLSAMSRPAQHVSSSASGVPSPPTSMAPPRSAPALRPSVPESDVPAGKEVLLVVEDDETFAEVLMDIGTEHGFHVVMAHTGAEAIELARQYRPAAITLDLRLPDSDGWVVLDRLKHDTTTKHIPVHVISAFSEPARAVEVGAFASLEKPVSRKALDDAFDQIHSFLQRSIRRVLLVEDDDVHRKAVADLMRADDVEVIQAADAESALEAFDEDVIDCAVVDLRLPDRSGLSLIAELSKRAVGRHLPIIVYTGKELEETEARELSRVSDAVIVKDVRSIDRLLDEVSLFLHRVDAATDGPASAPRIDPALENRRVLVVDDDVRNVFALTALLEQYEMIVEYADNGQKALDRLADREQPGVDVVLMDIMMPEMDGYETTRRIRNQTRFKNLPIIALTAKAMRGDREKCIEAGASDYVTKPVDTQQLLSLLRVWLHR